GDGAGRGAGGRGEGDAGRRVEGRGGGIGEVRLAEREVRIPEGEPSLADRRGREEEPRVEGVGDVAEEERLLEGGGPPEEEEDEAREQEGRRERCPASHAPVVFFASRNSS